MAIEAPGPRDPRTPDRLAVDIAIRLSLLGLFTYLVLTLIAPFLSILLWSIILSVALYPVFAWLRDHLWGRSRVAAALLTFAVLAITLGPTTILISSLIRSLEVMAERVHGGRIALPGLPDRIRELPVVGANITNAWELAASNLEAFFTTYRGALVGAGEWLLHAVAGLAGSVLVILIAVLISGFLYFPGPRLVALFRGFAVRVAGAHGGEFVNLSGATIRNVARGVIGVAALQALLIGVGLLVADIPAAGLLTLACLVLAIVQVGTAPIVIPILIWAWLEMSTGAALGLTLYLIPVTVIDNVLKPLLMRKGLPTPTLVILAGVIGGTVSYGLIGLFLGPIVLAVFYELLVYWIQAGSLAPPPGAGAVTPPPAEAESSR